MVGIDIYQRTSVARPVSHFNVLSRLRLVVDSLVLSSVRKGPTPKTNRRIFKSFLTTKRLLQGYRLSKRLSMHENLPRYRVNLHKPFIASFIKGRCSDKDIVQLRNMNVIGQL